MPVKRRVLCVDDNVDICDLVRTILVDYEVDVAQSKTEGLRKVESGLFDLYLLDYSLPDGTGLELATLIRQFDEFTPILFTLPTPLSLRDGQLSEFGAQGVVLMDDLPDDLLRQVARIFT